MPNLGTTQFLLPLLLLLLSVCIYLGPLDGLAVAYKAHYRLYGEIGSHLRSLRHNTSRATDIHLLPFIQLLPAEIMTMDKRLVGM